MAQNGIISRLSAGEPDNSVNKQVVNLIRESLQEKVQPFKKQKTRNELNETIIAVLGEWLSCYTVIGFDLDKEPVIISRAYKPMEGEALISLTKKVLQNIVNGHG